MARITQTDKDNFINKLSPHAIKGWHEYKVLPSLTIAQAILESGWGTSNKIPNNLFGIKASGDWNGKKELVRTHEYVNGKKIYIDAWFRVYDNIYESLQDRYVFLGRARYKKVVGERNYKTACHEIWRAGYATDINYPVKLIQIIEQNKLYEVDKQAMMPIPTVKPIKPIDNNPSSWSVDAWNWTKQEGVLDGNRPKSDLTREELSVTLMRLFK